jgi:hypothetical protein
MVSRLLLTLVVAGLLCCGHAKAENNKELQGMDRIKAIHCGHGNQPDCPPLPPPPVPTPRITFNPSIPSMPDTSPVGAQITQIIVTMSDGSPFSGSLGYGSPYFNDGGICAIQGGSPPTVILGAKFPPGQSTQYCTITATQ